MGSLNRARYKARLQVTNSLFTFSHSPIELVATIDLVETALRWNLIEIKNRVTELALLYGIIFVIFEI